MDNFWVQAIAIPQDIYFMVQYTGGALDVKLHKIDKSRTSVSTNVADFSAIFLSQSITMSQQYLYFAFIIKLSISRLKTLEKNCF